MTIRWGIIGTGGIAGTLASDLALVADAELAAVGSRDAARAAEFAGRYGVARSYGSYAELADDPDLDVIYVATPHQDHLDSARLGLEAGKAVLCEKPLTVTADEAVRLVGLARDRGLLLVEAVWARFNPLLRKAVDLVDEGAIGPVRLVQANFGFAADVDDEHRLLNPALAGGALLDLGVYPVQMANLFLGEPDEVMGTGMRHPRTGVDIDASAILVHHPTESRPAARALLHTSLVSGPTNRLEVVGSRGRLVTDRFLNCQQLTLVRDGGEPETFEVSPPGRGYTYQIEEVHRCLAAGLGETPMMPLEASLQTMRTLDAWQALIPEESA